MSVNLQIKKRKCVCSILSFEDLVFRRLPVGSHPVSLSPCWGLQPAPSRPRLKPRRKRCRCKHRPWRRLLFLNTINTSRRSSRGARRRINPQVDGNLPDLAHSGDRVKAGQILMQIDPAKQEATVARPRPRNSKNWRSIKYNQIEVERQHKLFDQGVTSRDALGPGGAGLSRTPKPTTNRAVASRDAGESSWATTTSARRSTGSSATFRSHLGDYVSATTMLTTVDENRDLEAYIYIPTERGLADAQGPAGGDSRQQRAICWNDRDRLHLAPGGQRTAGHSGEGAGAADLAKLREPATGEGARDLEQRRHAGSSGAGGYAAGRPDLCLRGAGSGRQVLCAAAGHHSAIRSATTMRCSADCRTATRSSSRERSSWWMAMPVQPLG